MSQQTALKFLIEMGSTLYLKSSQHNNNNNNNNNNKSDAGHRPERRSISSQLQWRDTTRKPRATQEGDNGEGEGGEGGEEEEEGGGRED